MRQSAHTGDPDPDLGVGVLDSIITRAAAAGRRLVSARDAHAGGTSAMVRAYQDVLAHSARLEASLGEANSRADVAVAERDSLASDLERSRQDSARYLEAGHEALRQARLLQRERDELRERLAALLEDHIRLPAAAGSVVPSQEAPRRPIAAAMPFETVVEREDVSETMPETRRETSTKPAEPATKAPFFGRAARQVPAPVSIEVSEVCIEDEIKAELTRSMQFRPGADAFRSEGVACLEDHERASIALAVEGFARLARPRRQPVAAE